MTALYLNPGAGNPWAGHNNEKLLFTETITFRVSVFDKRGGVDEIGSKTKIIRKLKCQSFNLSIEKLRERNRKQCKRTK